MDAPAESNCPLKSSPIQPRSIQTARSKESQRLAQRRQFTRHGDNRARPIDPGSGRGICGLVREQAEPAPKSEPRSFWGRACGSTGRAAVQHDRGQGFRIVPAVAAWELMAANAIFFGESWRIRCRPKSPHPSFQQHWTWSEPAYAWQPAFDGVVQRQERTFQKKLAWDRARR